jgi:hypothetical protein
MVVVPALAAVTIPVDIPIVATDGVLLLQVPPEVVFVNVVV